MSNYEKVKEWRKRNPEKRAAQSNREGKTEYSRNKHLRRYYGISLEEYNTMFVNQNGSCAICEVHQSQTTKRLFVDHCHTTGAIRGLLCSQCNSMLGMAKDNQETLAKAIVYLNKTGY